MKRTEIKLFGGKIAGWIEEDGSGNKVATSYGGKTVARYDKASNITKDFYGRIVAYGDVASGLILLNSGYRL